MALDRIVNPSIRLDRLPEYRPVAESEYRITLHDDRTLACLLFGDVEARPVLYCHGYPGSRLEGRLAASAGRRIGMRLVAPDRPGFGESSFKPGRTIGGWTEDVVQLVDRLGLDRFAVLGVSGGGPYALACAARIPDRVSGVALVGGLGPLSRPELTTEMRPLNRGVLRLAERSPSLARLVVRMLAAGIRWSPRLYVSAMSVGAPRGDHRILAHQAYRTLVVDSTREAVRHGGRGVAWEVTLFARPWDFELAAVRAPVRIWHGLDDDIVPVAIARHLNESLPNSECRYLPGEGHLVVSDLEAILADLCGA
jgi:pimeloyl-ACP methyl ester carboxylesterase